MQKFRVLLATTRYRTHTCPVTFTCSMIIVQTVKTQFMQLCMVKSSSWGHTSEVTTLKQAMWLLTNNTCFTDTVTKRRLLCSAMRRHTTRHASAGWRRLHNTTCCRLAGRLRACHTMVVMNFTTRSLDFSNICAIHTITGVSCKLRNEFHKWRKIRIYRIIPFVIKCMFCAIYLWQNLETCQVYPRYSIECLFQPPCIASPRLSNLFANHLQPAEIHGL